MSAHLPHSEAARAVVFAIEHLVRIKIMHGDTSDWSRAARDALAEKLDALVNPRPEPYVDPRLAAAVICRHELACPRCFPTHERDSARLFAEVKRLEAERERLERENSLLRRQRDDWRSLYERVR